MVDGGVEERGKAGRLTCTGEVAGRRKSKVSREVAMSPPSRQPFSRSFLFGQAPSPEPITKTRLRFARASRFPL